MSDLETIASRIIAPLSLLLLYLFIFWLSKWVANKVTPYNISTEISEKRNKAVALSLSGYLIAVTIIFCSVLIGPSQGVVNDLKIFSIQ